MMIIMLLIPINLFSVYGLNFTNQTTNSTDQTFLISPENCLFHETTNNKYCSIYHSFNISRKLNYTEIFTIPEVNVTIESPGLGTCPQCPEIIKCEVNQTILPKVGYNNKTFVTIKDDYCDITMTIGGCEVPIRYDIPEGYHLIEESDWTSISTCLNDSRICVEEKSACIFQKKQCYIEKTELREQVCPISPMSMIDSDKILTQFSKDHLLDFARLSEPINTLEFSDLVSPEASGQEKARADFWSEIALEQYVKVGFAKAEVKTRTIIDQRTGDKTEYNYFEYKPLITPYCLNTTQEIVEVYKKGKSIGFKTAGFILIGLFCLWFLASVLDAHVPGMPWR